MIFKKNIKKKKLSSFFYKPNLLTRKKLLRVLSVCKKKIFNLNFAIILLAVKKSLYYKSMFKDISGAKYILGDHSSMLIYGASLVLNLCVFAKKEWINSIGISIESLTDLI